MIAVREELKQNGRYVIVVGDSNIRGQSIPTAKVLAEIAEKNGYIFELSFKYVIVIDIFIFHEVTVAASSNTMKYWY